MLQIQSFLCENYIPKISFGHLHCTIAVLQASAARCTYTLYNCSRYGVSTLLLAIMILKTEFDTFE